MNHNAPGAVKGAVPRMRRKLLVEMCKRLPEYSFTFSFSLGSAKERDTIGYDTKAQM